MVKEGKTTSWSTTLEPVTKIDLEAGDCCNIRRFGSWARFHRGPRRTASCLLAELATYENCVLVAGCQRSGTTMLTRIIAGAEGFRRLAITRDDELDAALSLGGLMRLPPKYRYCFQTTYLNERYPEYSGLRPGQKLIWVLRNPYSVVFSMTHHWRRSALKRLYESCTLSDPELPQRWRIRTRWRLPPGKIERACLAYAVKTRQIEQISDLVNPDQLLVIDYDDLVQRKNELFPRIFRFIGATYHPQYTDAIRPDSLGKSQRLTRREKLLVNDIAVPAYERSRKFMSF